MTEQANQVKQKTQPTQIWSPVEGLNQKREIYRIGFGKNDSRSKTKSDEELVLSQKKKTYLFGRPSIDEMMRRRQERYFAFTRRKESMRRCYMNGGEDLLIYYS